MASNPDYGVNSSAREIAQAYASSIKGKTALITGASLDGIGDTVAQVFASAGAATIIITGRNDEKLSAAHSALSSAYPQTHFIPHKLDLNSLAASKASAEALLADNSIPAIDITIANAGFSSRTNVRQFTSDGIESHFGANHLGHFVFITTLLPKIRAAAKNNIPGATRVVLVSSSAMMASPIRFSDWNFDRHSMDVPEEEQPLWFAHPMFDEPASPVPYSYLTAYAHSKTANALMALEMSRLYREEGIAAYSIDPGVTMSGAAKKAVTETIRKRLEERNIPIKSVDEGAAVVVVAALDPGLTGEKGTHLKDCQVLGEKVPAWSRDAAAAERLWKLSEEIVSSKLE
ncbi:hypothetical protein GRF29_216g100621 [Pseudopithomyces chartarum]|uniref:Short-chain dehydrogenase n=1 Tax=Pseudopithomyces chartarum TaxID=1892770 RepID=A0AAN6RCC1_9PLEO|nr:hypothetical protein GRF29_216g100621 [Pseudopithomyces chartarum]